MPFEFKLPDIGEGVAEGEIVKWFVAEGDTVERDQPMVEVLTDKANVEIPAPRAGTILKILAREGETVPVHATLVVIGEPGEVVAAGGATDGGGAKSSGRETGEGARAHRSARPAGAGEAPGERLQAPGAAPAEAGTQAAAAPPGARAGVREQPRAPGGPVRDNEEEELGARAPRERKRGVTADAQRRGRATPRERDTGSSERIDGDGAGGAPASGAGSDRKRRRISPRDRVLAMPGVRKFARDQGVDLALVEPSGSQGHILRGDVERFLAESRRAGTREDATPAARPAQGREQEVEILSPAEGDVSDKVRPLYPHAAPSQPRRRLPDEPEEEIVPYRGVRRQIGRRMAQSLFTAPHYTYVEEVDADALVALRREAQSLAEERGVKLTYLPFIVKALVPCLRAFPLLNATLDEEAQQIHLKKRYHIGIATASEEGLIVPVLRDADTLSILEIAGEIRRLADAARDRSIKIEELRGSTFTITSLGPLGGLLATPIINFPEVAILGVHAIKQKPVVKDGAVVAGNVMNLSLSFDHRVVDGAVGAEFTRMLVRYLENPQLLLLES